MTVLTTARMRLEPFTEAHIEGLSAVNSDPEVMRYISGRPQTLDETIAVVQRVKQRWREFGYSWWAAVERTSGEVIGAGCLQNLRKDASLLPDPACPLEIGWRLRRDRWHQGLATEAARAVADFAFSAVHADELYAVCDPQNTASANVMKRLGMQYLGLETWYGKSLATYRTTIAAWSGREGSTTPAR